MKSSSMLCAVVTLLSGISCLNASGTVVLDLECDGGAPFACKYQNGYRNSGNVFNDINTLAQNLNGLTDGIVSADNGTNEFFGGDSSNYSIAGGMPGSCHDLLTFNNFKCNGGLGKIVFNGGSRCKPSVRLSGDANSMHLPETECNNIPVFKMEFSGGNANDKASISSLSTNSKMGLSYSNPIVINGRNCNRVGNDLCMIANPGTNNFCFPNSCGNNFVGVTPIEVPVLSNMLRQRGYVVTKVEASPNMMPGAQVIRLEQANVNNIADTLFRGRGVAIDMRGILLNQRSDASGKILNKLFKKWRNEREDGFENENNDFLNISSSIL